MPSHLVWGCHPNLQYESNWIRFLLQPLYESELFIFHSSECLSSIPCSDHIYLIESGLTRLRKSITTHELKIHDSRRLERLNQLKHYPLTLIHLSDEEGFDADSFYPDLSPHISIFRNFYHQRFAQMSNEINTFPIGPRDIFLPLPTILNSFTCNHRSIPWSFMGTLWTSGQRNLAVSSFLRNIPNGFFYELNPLVKASST